MKKIPLTKGQFALVDDKDFDQLMRHKWCAQKGRHTFYAVRSGSVSEGRKTILMHRQLLGLKGPQIDHRDGNGLNNTRANLRTATQSQNLRNAQLRKDNSSGFKGVYLHKSGRYTASLAYGKKGHHLGYFNTAEAAHAAYIVAAKRLFGEFARGK